jgi:hypothetical protein
MAGCCEYGNELLGSIKGGEFLDELSDCQLLKKDSAAQFENAVPPCRIRFLSPISLYL